MESLHYKNVVVDSPHAIPHVINDMELKGFKFVQVVSQVYRYGQKQHPTTILLFENLKFKR